MSEMKRAILFFAGVSLVIVAVWFWHGNVIAGGEESFSIFNNVSIASQISSWQEAGTGYSMPVYMTRLFPILFVKFIRLLGAPLFLTQALVFSVLILAGTLGVYYLVFELLKNKVSSKIAVVSSLFYLFNLYSESQIFGRFLYSSIFLWALIPGSLFFWVKWIRNGKVKFLIAFLAICFFFSNAYLQPAHLLTFWTPLFLFSFFDVYKFRNDHSKSARLIALSVLGGSMWFVTNSWWLYPYLILGNSSFSELPDWKSNLESLVSVSQYFSNKQLLLLKQSFLFGPQSLFYEFYSQTWVSVISYLALTVTIFGWIKMKQGKYWMFLTITMLFAWFINKGSNHPFGYEFYKYLFSTFSFSAVLRNPYEKFGLVLLLPYSIFFGLGLFSFAETIRRSLRNLVIIIALIVICGILVVPMWNGEIFARTKVFIPDYYKDANMFLGSHGFDGRILMLPILGGDGVAYNWGYSGVEPSEFLFDRPSVSKILRAKYFDNKYLDLYKKFNDNENYNILLDEMNIRYLVLHNDIIASASGTKTPAEVKQILQKNPDIQFIKSFGELDVYEYIKDPKSSLFITQGEDHSAVSYKKLSPTHYTVSIQNATKPFRLINKSTFNDYWTAKVENNVIDKHVLVYGYANGWEINKLGSYEIDVVFRVWPWD